MSGNKGPQRGVFIPPRVYLIADFGKRVAEPPSATEGELERALATVEAWGATARQRGDMQAVKDAWRREAELLAMVAARE